MFIQFNFKTLVKWNKVGIIRMSCMQALNFNSTQSNLLEISDDTCLHEKSLLQTMVNIQNTATGHVYDNCERSFLSLAQIILLLFC